MKKITLRQKIENAEARIADTAAKLARCQSRLHAKQLQDFWLTADMARLLNQPAADITAADKRWYWRAVKRSEELKQSIEIAEWCVDDYKRRLANQSRYLRKLQNMQAAIDAENAEEDAYIDALITLAGAIA